MSKNQEFTKRASNFAISIIRFTKTLPKSREYWIISDQIIRSSCSIGANMTEASSASSKKDYINFYTHALKSANESKFWISLLIDSGRASKTLAEPLLTETTEISKILGASVITMKNITRFEI